MTEELTNKTIAVLKQLLPDWHSDADDQSIHGGNVIGEITYKDVRDIKAVLSQIDQQTVNEER
jgi:hypothetical protein